MTAKRLRALEAFDHVEIRMRVQIPHTLKILLPRVLKPSFGSNMVI
jgi:hypothetical protein